MKRKIVEPDYWLTYRKILIKSGPLKPNFWVSPYYFYSAGWVPYSRDGWVWWANPDNRKEAMIMPIRIDPTERDRFWGKYGSMEGWYDMLRDNPPPVDFIWSDFGDSYYTDVWRNLGMKKEFLDKEFNFYPFDFQDMEGASWSTFRKNSRKWLRSQEIEPIDYRHIENTKDIEGVLLDWLGVRPPDEIIEDSELLLKYIHVAPNRMGLYRGDECVGVNLFEIVPKGCIFRFSFHIDEPFLSEFLRLYFYQRLDPVDIPVNDGGTLGKNGLLFYKQKMNPYFVRDIFSWRKT